MRRNAAVLVIDDEEVMRDILGTLLEREGYSVRLASSGQEGLDLAKSLPFDAVIVDVMMPGIDGLQVLDELKKHDEELPVLMITAYASMESAISAMKKGAFDYITKPFKNDEVLVVLQNAIERRQLVAENVALAQGYGRSGLLGAIDWRSTARAARAALAMVDCDIDPDTRVQALSRTGWQPSQVISDHHQPYVKAVQEVLPEAEHIRTGLHRARGETTKPIERSHVFTRDRLRASRGVKTLATGQRFFEGFEALHSLRCGHTRLTELVPEFDPTQATAHDRVRAVAHAVAVLGTRLAKTTPRAV